MTHEEALKAAREPLESTEDYKYTDHGPEEAYDILNALVMRSAADTAWRNAEIAKDEERRKRFEMESRGENVKARLADLLITIFDYYPSMSYKEEVEEGSHFPRKSITLSWYGDSFNDAIGA